MRRLILLSHFTLSNMHNRIARVLLPARSLLNFYSTPQEQNGALYNLNGQGVSLIRIDWFLWWLPPGECFERGLNTLLVDYITHYRDYPCCMYLWLTIYGVEEREKNIFYWNIFIIFSPNKIYTGDPSFFHCTFSSNQRNVCGFYFNSVRQYEYPFSIFVWKAVSLSQAVCGFLLCK